MQVRRAGTGLGEKGLGLLVRAGGAEEERASQARQESAGVGGVQASGNWSSGAAAGLPTLPPTQPSLSINPRKARCWEIRLGCGGEAVRPTAWPSLLQQLPTRVPPYPVPTARA